ncbi:trichohyalin isoform X2 [Heterodontus francisci]|uniref:trichohyalin isoform X2 n=1 Tax=Heterodontus francisci TaxID=7792 RepID=UPI00355C7EBE
MSGSYRRPLISRRPRRCQLVDVIRTEETQLERSTAKLQQGLSVEEEKLIERKPQLREADLTPSKVLQQSKYSMQDIQSLKETVEKGQQDATALESRQQGPQNEAEKASKELVVPEFKRDGCLQDLRDLEGERELLKPHSAMIQSNAQGRMQNEIATLILERDDLRACLRQLESSLSFLERQELERELKSMKNEFFTEQQSTRIRIKQLQQQLEESEVRLEQRTAEVTQLLERNSNLESQVRELEKSLQAERAAPNSNNSNHVHELSSQLTERDLKVSALEKILSEKELEQLRLRETVVVLRAEKKAQLSAMETLRKEHERQLTVTAVEKHWEQAKHEETLTLREQAWAQEKSMKKLNEELKQEAKELVQNALAQDHRRCEEDREGQLQQQCLSLEEENGRALKQANEDLEKEKRNSLALQNKIVELQKRIEELEFQCRSLQREMDQAVSNVRTLLTEENRKEIKQLREEMQLEKKHELERLTSKMDLMEEELLILRAENNEASLKEREARMQGERVERSFISEIKMECERIQVLMQSTQVRALGRAVSPSRSKLGSLTQMTLGQAIHTLRRAGEDLRQLVMDLHQELESQRCAVHHLQRDKDHNEELSKLQRPQLKDSRGREEHKLQQHLQEKEKALQVVQTDMAKWKDGPACKHTCKFQEKLNTELEKRLYKHRSEHQRKVEMLENEIHPLPLEHSETSHLRSAFTPSMASSAVVSLRQKDFGTLKLLRHLQSRVKQLRAENITYHGANPKDPDILHVTAGSSYREMSRVTPERLLCFAGKESRK